MLRCCGSVRLGSRGWGVGVDQGSNYWIAAQFFQAAAAAWPDAADRDAQLGADLGIRRGRVFGEQGDQLLAAAGPGNTARVLAAFPGAGWSFASCGLAVVWRYGRGGGAFAGKALRDRHVVNVPAAAVGRLVSR